MILDATERNSKPLCDRGLGHRSLERFYLRYLIWQKFPLPGSTLRAAMKGLVLAIPLVVLPFEMARVAASEVSVAAIVRGLGPFCWRLAMDQFAHEAVRPI